MTTKILMPALSPTMKEGNLTKWLVKEGDEIKAGDILAEIETDKATMEVEAVDEGKLTSILVKEGTESVSVNTPIAILDGSGEDLIVSEEAVEVSNNQEELNETEKNSTTEEIKKSYKEHDLNKNTNFNKKILASPYAKKISNDRNIDLSSINGSGPNGRIIKRDLENIDKSEIEFFSSSEYKIIEPSNIRKIIAKRTTQTKNTIPHFYLSVTSKVDKLLKLRQKINESNNKTKVSINDLLVKALAIAQSKNPKSNVYWHNEKIIQYFTVDVSIAVALEDGLVTPIIKNTDKKGIFEISQEIKNLVDKAKLGKLTKEEYHGGTISLSNLGMFGIDEFSAIINPPSSCILAVGSIKNTFELINNKIEEINILKSTLSADHRSLDGAIAAKLLKDFNDIIENPLELWLQSNDMEII